MKKVYPIFTIFLVLFIFCATQNLEAQSLKKITKTITKIKWKLDFEEVLKTMPTDMQAVFETSMNAEQKQKFKDEIEKQRYWFKKNYEYEVLNSVNGTEKGKWTITQESESTIIKMTDTEGESAIFELNYFSKKKIILLPKQADPNMAQLILVRPK